MLSKQPITARSTLVTVVAFYAWGSATVQRRPVPEQPVHLIRPAWAAASMPWTRSGCHGTPSSANSAGKKRRALNLAGIATLTGVQIISNTATVDTFGIGGGVNATAALTLTNATVLSNTSNSDGGGVIVAAPATIIGGSYQGNRATSIYGSGGAIFVNNGSLTLRDATVSNNWAGPTAAAYRSMVRVNDQRRDAGRQHGAGDQGGGLNVSAALVANRRAGAAQHQHLLRRRRLPLPTPLHKSPAAASRTTFARPQAVSAAVVCLSPGHRQCALYGGNAATGSGGAFT